MRKILYSPRYGAGWVSWYSGSNEEKLWMLEYPGFVQALERQAKHDAKKNELARPERHRVDWAKMPCMAVIEACLAADEAVRAAGAYFMGGPDEYASWPYEIVRALPQFLLDWKSAFPEQEFPFLGGLSDLEIYETSEDGRVRIEDHDGYEYVEPVYDDEF